MKKLLTLSVLAIPALAHHSIAGDYFMDQRATVEGEVMQFQFRNPHSWVDLKGVDPKSGNTVTWSIEWSGAGRLGRENVTAETLKPGDHVVITGQPGRVADGHRLHVLKIERPADGWKWSRSPRY
jgi:hypothetical protein